MGLAASQGRLLMLTMRQSDVEGKLQFVANQRLSLSRQSSELSSQHNKALSARKLLWSTDEGTSNLTYDLLMTPTASNMANQYLAADANGRVILNDKFANIWGNATSGNNAGSVTCVQFLRANMPSINQTTAEQYIIAHGPAAGTTDPSANPVTAAGNIATSLSNVLNVIGYVGVLDGTASSTGFPVDNNNNISLPCYTSLKQEFETIRQNLVNIKNSAAYASYSAVQKTYVTTMTTNVDTALRALESAKNDTDAAHRRGALATIKAIFEGTPFGTTIPGASVHPDTKDAGSMDGIPRTSKHWWGYDGTNNEGWACTFAGVNFTNALGITYSDYYKNNMTDLNTLLTETVTRSSLGTTPISAEQSQANFYINIYDQIASKGWVRNSGLSTDTTGKYFQNLILNGSAFLYKYSSGVWSLSSASDAESPVRNVADEEAIAREESNYEALKDRLDYKEKLLDVEQNNLDTERASIVTEMESVQKIIDNNIKKFKMFEA